MTQPIEDKAGTINYCGTIQDVKNVLDIAMGSTAQSFCELWKQKDHWNQKGNKFDPTHNMTGESNYRLGLIELYGLYIYPTIMKVKGGQQWGWALEKTVLVPGVRTFTNGDPGYPDTTDVVHIENYRTAHEVAVAAVMLLVNDSIYNALNAEVEAKAHQETTQQANDRF